MSFPFAPPQGYPGGSASQPVKVATGTVTSSSGTVAFTLVGGTSYSAHSLTITPPSNATTIVAVRATHGKINSTSSNFPGLAIPMGYADGENSTSLATITLPDSTTAIYTYSFESGGSLVLTVSSIVIPIGSAGALYYYAVYYQ